MTPPSNPNHGAVPTEPRFRKPSLYPSELQGHSNTAETSVNPILSSTSSQSHGTDTVVQSCRHCQQAIAPLLDPWGYDNFMGQKYGHYHIKASDENADGVYVITCADGENEAEPQDSFDEYIEQLRAQSRGTVDYFNFSLLMAAKPVWMGRARKLSQAEQILGWADNENMNSGGAQ